MELLKNMHVIRILCHKEIEWMRFGDRDNEKAGDKERCE